MVTPLPTAQVAAATEYNFAGITVSAQLLGTVVVGVAVLIALFAGGYVVYKGWKEGKLRFPYFTKYPIMALVDRRRTGGSYHTDLTSLRKHFNKLGTVSYEFKTGEVIPRSTYEAIHATSPVPFVMLEEYEAGEFHPIFVRHLDQYSAQCQNCGAYYIGETKDLPLEGMPACRACKKTFFKDPKTGKETYSLKLRHSLLEMESRVDKEMSLAIASEAANLNENYENKEWWQALSAQILLGVLGVCMAIILYVAFTNGQVYADAAVAQANAARELGSALVNATKELYVTRTGITPTILPPAP